MSDESQGPGWWLASDGKWYPPELAPGATPPPAPETPPSGGYTPPGASGGYVPPAGYAAPSGYGAPGGPPSADVGTALSYAWRKFWQNPGPLLVIALIVAAVYLVFGIIALRISSLSGQLIFRIISFFIGQIVTLGLYRAGLMVTAGEDLDIGRVFNTDRLGDFIVGSILYSLIVLVGLILCIIPGIIAAVLLYFYGFYILDRGLSATDALRASYELVRANTGTVVGLLIVAFLVYIVGAILCGVGLLITGPVSLIMVAYGYRVLNNEPVAP